MKRLRIGLQTARLEYGYGVKIWQGALFTAQQLDADIIVFPGRNLECPHNFDYQYNRIFPLMNKKNLDALIMVTTLVSNFVSEEELKVFFSRFTDIPVISIGTVIPGIPSIVIDNRNGIQAITQHMIEKHGAKKLAFIKGPESNWEANERFLAYKDELEAHGIPLDEALVAQGDFTLHSAKSALERILAESDGFPDVFMCANDEMAIEGMKLLKEKGVRIPQMTAITGFDDIHETSAQAVPITTVSQPLIEMIHQAVHMAVDMVHGKKVPEKTVLPTQAVFRSSCGCTIHCINDIAKLKKISDNAKAGPDADVYTKFMSILEEKNFDSINDVEKRADTIRSVISQILLHSQKDTGQISEDQEIMEFLNSFRETLTEESKKGLPPEDWYMILSLLSDLSDMNEQTPDRNERFAYLIRACTLLAIDTALVTRAAGQYESERLYNLLQELEYSLSSVLEMDDLVHIMARQFPLLGIRTFFLSQYADEWEHKWNTPWNIPSVSRYIAWMKDSDEQNLHHKDKKYSSDYLFHPDIQGNNGCSFVVYPLFFRENHYGTLVYELGLRNGLIYESLTTQIAGVLKRIFLYDAKDKAELRLRQALRDLEVYNEQLSNLSYTDELTGLYNRRGFLKMAEQQLSLTRQMKQCAMLIFGDLDGLKMINDTYGHDKGDWALKTTGMALKGTFRSMDVISRLGGDEFTVFATNLREEQIPRFEARIKELLEAKNAESGEPSGLSISFGYACCMPEDTKQIEDYIREADIRLYNQKNKKSTHTTTEYGGNDPAAH